MVGPTSVLYNKENLLKIVCYRVSVTNHYVFLKRVSPLSYCTCFLLYHLNPTHIHTISLYSNNRTKVNRCTSTAFESNCSYIESVKRYTLFALMILKLEIKLVVIEMVHKLLLLFVSTRQTHKILRLDSYVIQYMRLAYN